VTSASSPTARNVVLATFVTQAVVTMSNSTLPTIAPKLAEVLAMDAALIGYQVSIRFGGAVTGTLFGGVLIGPSVFAAAYGILGSYSATLILLAVASAVGGVLLVLARQAAPARRRAA
jgi:predicted lipid-binding transport protein (Tim44 family)